MANIIIAIKYVFAYELLDYFNGQLDRWNGVSINILASLSIICYANIARF